MAQPDQDSRAREPAVALPLAAGDLAAALSFYRSAFGAVETQRECLLDGSVLCVDLALGPHRLTLSEYEAVLGGVATAAARRPVYDLHCEQPETMVSRAVAAGAVRETGQGSDVSAAVVVRDPFGHRWAINPR
jgi:PhnB protein